LVGLRVVVLWGEIVVLGAIVIHSPMVPFIHSGTFKALFGGRGVVRRGSGRVVMLGDLGRGDVVAGSRRSGGDDLVEVGSGGNLGGRGG
jgi:hypothetical protein